jgi:hypothetical protein
LSDALTQLDPSGLCHRDLRNEHQTASPVGEGPAGASFL